MAVALDTFLVAVYTQIDTLYQTHIAPHTPVRRGRRPVMADSEVLTLLLVGQWLGRSERALLRWAHAHLAVAFPVLLSQSAFNRRARALGPVLTQLMLALADTLNAAATPYQVVDTVPVPLARQCRGERHRLFAEGAITGFVLGPANTQERWLLDAWLTWRVSPAGLPWTKDDPPRSHARGGGYVGPTGPRWGPDSAGAWAPGPYLADDGFTGAHWQAHWQTDTAATVLPTASSPPLLRRRHCGWRQVIETVNGALEQVFQLAYPQAKTAWGVVTRIAAKCAALNLGIWLNRSLGRPDLALATVFPR